MKSDAKILIIIPARSGSKGLRDKNKKIFNGNPLCSITFEFASNLSKFYESSVVVSTNDPEIQKLSESFFEKSGYERSEALSGGAGTVDKIGRNAFSHHFTTLSFEDRQNFLIGNGFFRKLWIAAPSSTISSDGLGPLYNARACQSCHIKDGKGHLPNTEKPLSLVIKVSFELTNLFFNLSLIRFINSSKFISFLIDRKIGLNLVIC